MFSIFNVQVLNRVVAAQVSDTTGDDKNY